jgi:hypothetical protein
MRCFPHEQRENIDSKLAGLDQPQNEHTANGVNATQPEL